jgi:pilus assembly protein CpaB
MKKIYILSILMAIVVGLSVYYFADSLQKAALQQNQVLKGNVIVAAQFIPANTEITAEMITAIDLPVEAINPLAARTPGEVVGTIAQYPIEADEQLLTTRVKKRGEASEDRLSYILKPGYRAMTIPVDSISGIAGHVSKGDFVDLVVTMINPEINDKNAVTFAIVENIEILGTGEKVISSTEAKSAGYGSLTLAVTPDQVLKIGYAIPQGIRVVLRPVLDPSSSEGAYYPTVFPGEPSAASATQTSAVSSPAETDATAA